MGSKWKEPRADISQLLSTTELWPEEPYSYLKRNWIPGQAKSWEREGPACYQNHSSKQPNEMSPREKMGVGWGERERRRKEEQGAFRSPPAPVGEDPLSVPWNMILSLFGISMGSMASLTP